MTSPTSFVVDDDRAAQLYIQDGDKGGSGYAINGNYILTARHVLCHQEQISWPENLEVQFRLWGDLDHGDKEWKSARLVWSDPLHDVALLSISEHDSAKSRTLTAIKQSKIKAILGRLPVSGYFECETFGWPRVLRSTDISKPMPFRGKTTARGRTPLENIRAIATELTPKNEEDWKGMSGAALRIQGTVVGVVVDADPRFKEGVLDVQAFSAIESKEPFWTHLSDCEVRELIEPTAEPTLLSPLNNLDRRNRAATIRRIRGDWIDGLLRNSLDSVARIELQLTSQPNAVALALNAIVQVPDRPPAKISHGTHISSIFDSHEQSLLILGGPGSGKTTLLLELAEELLNRAEANESHAIPIVFNLSSWALSRKPLASWMIDEMNLRSDIPRPVAREWIATEGVIPLLDGLDEVNPAYRLPCLEAINGFRSEHGFLPIAVCSRIADYEDLGHKLHLRSAVVVQALDAGDVDTALSHNPQLNRLREAVKQDATFAELLRTPLMLWIAALAYHNTPEKIDTDEGVEQMRGHLFSAYVESMFKRRAVSEEYSQENIYRWLTRLACSLGRNRLSIFTLESLSFNFFDSYRLRILSRCTTGIAVLVTYSVTCFLVSAVGYTGSGLLGRILSLFPTLNVYPSSWFAQVSYMVDAGQMNVIVLAPIITIIAIAIDLQPSEKIDLGFRNISTRIKRALIGFASFFALFPLLLTIGDYQNYSSVPEFVSDYRANITGNHEVLGASSPLLMGLLTALFLLVLAPNSSERSSCNEGTLRSIKVALTMTGLVVILGMFIALHDGLHGWLLLASLTLGLAGGLFVIKHYALRLFLWMMRIGPYNYPAFLDYANERILLRKIGGSYIFTHRMLQEYFASRNLVANEAVIQARARANRCGAQKF